VNVEILAQSLLRANVLANAYDYDAYTDWRTTQADALGESAGRVCYLSWGRPNPATASNAGYLANILRQGHESVLEHASVTFLVRDVSRSLLAELSRHRHLSFSVVSQRYVDYGATEPVIPPALNEDETNVLASAYEDALDAYDGLVARLMRRGVPRKRAREAARSVLPNAAPVDLIVSGNLRAWRDVLRKRNSPAADAEIQLFSAEVLRHLRNIAPNSVQDFKEDSANV
jgi:thymidylate synthase (FAD)